MDLARIVQFLPIDTVFAWKSRCICSQLSSPSLDHIENNRQNDAQQQRRGQWKVKSRVLTAIDDVSGKAAEGQVGASQNGQNGACQDQNQADCDQDFPQVCDILVSPVS
jgi:hypothetical protein